MPMSRKRSRQQQGQEEHAENGLPLSPRGAAAANCMLPPSNTSNNSNNDNNDNKNNNKQKQNNKNHDDDFVLGSKLKSVPSSSASSSSKSTLFGRVMQQQQSVHDKSLPSFTTPTKAPRPPACLLSPGGFNLRNAVESAVASSPFAFADHYYNHNHSQESLASHSPATPKPAWRDAESMDTLPIDWSLCYKLTLQSAALDPPHAWRWMQRTIHDSSSPDDTPATKWQAARNYWQYPLQNNATNNITRQYSSQITDASNLSRLDATSKFPSKAAWSKQTMTATIKPTEIAWQQLQPSEVYTSTQEQYWKTAFIALYQSWRLQGDFYFYSTCDSHTLLFFHDKQQTPQVLISSSSKAFRTWAQKQGTKLYMGKQVWNEETWQQSASKPIVQPHSPAAAAELAALRRASVLKQTAGAEVKFKSRNTSATLAELRRACLQVPALRVEGLDDCAVVAEFYANSGGQIAGSANQLPALVSPKPFVHASLQQTAVRLQAGGRVEISGFLMPHAVRGLVQAVVDALHHQDDARLEVNSHRTQPTPVVRPLEQVVVGQPTLLALQEDDGQYHAEVITQVVWDSDQPDNISFKVVAA